MSSPFVGEVRIFAGNFAPAGWMFCEGQLLPISEFETIFNLIGTTYGGDGQNTFALPDLRGRVPMHMGTGSGSTVTLAESFGVESVTLTAQQIPGHTHSLSAAATGTVLSPLNAFPAVPASTVTGLQPYAPSAGATLVNLIPTFLQLSGGSQPHENLQPYLCVNFIISLFGIFPSQT